MIKNNFRILEKQYAYLQTILKAPVKFEKDWPKNVGVAGRRMVGALMDGLTDGQTLKISEGIKITNEMRVSQIQLIKKNKKT